MNTVSEIFSQLVTCVPPDGAIGAHMAAVQECRTAYRDLAKRVLEQLEGYG